MTKVLVIDDQDNTRRTVREMLERGGYEIMEASNGKEGLQRIEQDPPDAVVSDILMPEMEGIETIRTIAKLKPGLPVIAITASKGMPYLDAAQRLGAVKGLYKPFSQAELLSALKEVLNPD